MRPSTCVHPVFRGSCCRKQSTVRTGVITNETNSLCGTNIKKKQFSHVSYTGRSCSFLSPDGRDIQDGLTERMIYRRHVGGFLVFSVGGL
jgi:hypothetical protein